MTPYERLAALERTEQDRIIRFLLEAENDLVKKLNAAQDSGAVGTARILRERRAEIQKTLNAMADGSRQWSDQASRSIYTGSMEVADENLKKLGLTLDVTASYGAPIHAEAIRVLADATYAPLSGYIGQVGRKVDDVFRSIQLQEARAALAGVETQASMARNIKKALQAQDVFAFTDKSGRDWTLNRYSQMVSRTLIRECETQGSANRMVQLGYTLGEVSYNRGSEPPCDVCQSWEGRTIDLDGSSQGKYPTIEQAKQDGLWHPNCFHNLLPHIVGASSTVLPKSG